ncbi:small peptidoglycan-associated lipoprotein [Robertmurraya korlensis]|uniref:small peptidoglycan-associated lipoprotein n=1 Tax=Robertmurraya korlensis TaxID=519977 RepID=UPI00203EA6DE|nr:small peptidoglycan-associated lipoprotein [Robertmurraya korlensis]MCM3600352.1 small peptidoglycan-associated lipoprotein [Robertmurraya korlensis]
MKGLSTLIVIMLLLIIVSCDSSKSKDVLPFDKDVKQLIFLSDESEYQYEAAYYDALIELKKIYPEAVKNMKTINPNRSEEYLDFLNIKDNPAIIVVYNNEIVATVNGEETVEEIVQPIAKILDEK